MTFEIAFTEDGALRIVAAGINLEITPEEVAACFSTVDKPLDKASRELSLLAKRLESFATSVEERDQHGSLPCGSIAAEEIETFFRDHIKLTRRYWRSHSLSSALHGRRSTRAAHRENALWQLVFSRRARVQAHLSQARSRITPVKSPEIRYVPVSVPDESVSSGLWARVQMVGRRLLHVRFASGSLPALGRSGSR